MFLRILVGAACIAVIAFVANHFWREHQAARAVEARKEGERCFNAERDFAAVMAGRPRSGSESESVLRIVVWGCRGQPKDRLPATLEPLR
jgi:hypothetical protein